MKSVIVSALCPIFIALNGSSQRTVSTSILIIEGSTVLMMLTRILFVNLAIITKYLLLFKPVSLVMRIFSIKNFEMLSYFVSVLLPLIISSLVLYA